jgi:serine/threonine protein kinase/tetratricopeptide (TPR) repeat protein
MSVETVFAAAAQKPSAERAAYLDEACGSDAELRRKVERLLQAHDAAGDFLDAPADRSGATTLFLPVAEQSESRIGPYRLMEQIGEGGFGLVYVAEQSAPVKRKVALKLIKPGMDTQQVVARFEAERQALALMDHPNIARVLDAGATDTGRPYFVMELVRGIPITDYCDRNQLTPRERLKLFITVCQAIQHAHQKGIVHRDIKPSNVLVASHDGKPAPKVIDFGVAKAMHRQLTDLTIYTQFAQMIGTPLYMSPEQAEISGIDIDTRSDIYSLGVLLYELLTGTTPLERNQLRQAAFDDIRRLIREEEPPKPSTRLSTSDSIASIAAQRHTEPAKLSSLVRGDLDWITMKALEKDRTRRYETANGLARDVQRYLDDEPVEASPPSMIYRLRKVVRRNRGLVLAASIVALALVGGAVAATVGLIRAERAADAERQAIEKERIAHAQAQARLRQVEKSNDVLTAIFEQLDIRRVRQDEEPLEAVLAERLVAAAQQLEGESVGDPLTVARMQQKLGVTLISLGFPTEAIAVLQKSLHTRQVNLSAEHPDVLVTKNDLARGYKDAGKLDIAVPLFEEVLRSKQATLEKDHPDTLTSMNDLAGAYKIAGHVDKALPLLEEAVRLSAAKIGPDHPDTLMSIHNLAATYRAAGQLEKALPLYEKTLRLRREKQGHDHPDTLLSLNSLAVGYRTAGDMNRALPLFEESMRLHKARLGEKHPDTLMSMNNLASVYRAVGQREQAIALYEETLRLLTAKMGRDHPNTLRTINNLAVAYKVGGQLDRALPLYEEAHRLMSHKIGPEQPDTLTSMFNLAECCRAAGQTDRALSLIETTCLGVEKLRFQHEYAGQIIAKACAAYQSAKQFAKAEDWQRKWLAAIREQSGAESLAYAGGLSALAPILIQQEKWDDGASVLRECLTIRVQKEPDVWTTFSTKSALGGCLVHQGRHAEAEPLLVDGYEGLKQCELQIPAPVRNARIIEALERLVRLYDAWGKPADAEKWRAVIDARKQPP